MCHKVSQTLLVTDTVISIPEEPPAVIQFNPYPLSWEFRQIIPCHFQAPIPATPHQFRQAFAFLEKRDAEGDSQPLPEADCQFIQELEANLLKWGIATRPKEKV